MSENRNVIEASCPHPSCQEKIPFRASLPSGVYQCFCYACKVKLSWATYANGDKKPYVTLEGGDDAHKP